MSEEVKTEINEDNVTKWIPLFAVLMFTGLMSYIAYDSFVASLLR